MDVKSILRTFRYTELQAKADRDPNAKRPPTIKFLTVALFVGILALGFSLLVMSYEPTTPASTGGAGGPLGVPDETTDPTNATTPTGVPDEQGAAAQDGPSAPVLGRND